jgi:uncharacterized RDD family membrane protein YckC
MPVRYASFWMRVLATFIDLALMSPLVVILWLMVGHPPSDEETAVLQSQLRGDRVPQAEFIRLETQNLAQMSVVMFIVFLVGWPYFTFMESSPAQGTVGKILLGLKVSDLDGRRIRWRKANGRYWGRWISQLPSSVGFLLPLFTEKKQALHDILSGCVVVKKQ